MALDLQALPGARPAPGTQFPPRGLAASSSGPSAGTPCASGHAAPAARALARRLERLNAALARGVRACSETLWQGADRPAATAPAAEVLHVARQELTLARFIVAVASGRPLPPLREDAPAAPRALPSKEAALLLLSHNGATAAGLIADLTDEQMERATSVFGTRLTAAQLVEELLLAHVEEHYAPVLGRN